MGFSNFVGKIMKQREEENKATRNDRQRQEIPHGDKAVQEERSWMSSIPKFLERGSSGCPLQGTGLDSAPRKTAPFPINVHFIYSA